MKLDKESSKKFGHKIYRTISNLVKPKNEVKKSQKKNLREDVSEPADSEEKNNFLRDE